MPGYKGLPSVLPAGSVHSRFRLERSFVGKPRAIYSKLPRTRNRHFTIIFIISQGDIPTTVRGMKAGSVAFLTKPFIED